jgi:hypothetical protein
VVRLGHYKGEQHAAESLGRALAQLMAAVPQARAPWKPPVPAP